MNLTQPDPRFPVFVGKFGDGNQSVFVFVAATDDRPARLTTWAKPIENANVIFVGDCSSAVRGLLLNYRNEELQEKIGMWPTVAAKLRAYLKIGGKGQRH